MKSLVHRLLSASRRFLWTLLLTFMIGLHNFYKGDNQTIDSIGKSKAPAEMQADVATKE